MGGAAAGGHTGARQRNDNRRLQNPSASFPPQPGPVPGRRHARRDRTPELAAPDRGARAARARACWSARRRTPTSRSRPAATSTPICVEGEVVRIVKAAENRVTAVLRGLERRRVTGFVQEKPYLVASFGPLAEVRKDADRDRRPRHGGLRRRQAAHRDLARHPGRDGAGARPEQGSGAASATSSRRPSTCRPRSARRCSSRATSPSACAACSCCCSARSSSSR